MRHTRTRKQPCLAPPNGAHLVAHGTCPNQVPIQTGRLKLGCGIAGAVTPFPRGRRERARHPPCVVQSTATSWALGKWFQKRPCK